MRILDNFITIEKLGSGMFGTVNLIESSGNRYALKIEKARDRAFDICNIMSTAFTEWREIDFSLTFANNFRDQFVSLLEYDIVDHCEYEYTEQYRNHLQYLPTHVTEILKEKENSSHCIRKIYSLVNGPLKNFMKKLKTQKEYYSIITQLIYICYLMASNGYTHNDLHSNNIGVVKCDIYETIEIDSHVLHITGYHIKLFDFGNVLHIGYKMTTEEEIQYKYNIKNEILRPLSKFMSFEENDQMNKLITWDDNLDFFEAWLTSTEYSKFDTLVTIENFQAKYKNGDEHSEEIKTFDLRKTNKFSRYIAYQLLFYDDFQKAYYGDKYIKTYEPIHYILIDDYLYILNNIDDLRAVTHCMIDKTNLCML